MLAGVDSLNKSILALSPTTSAMQGGMNLANVICNYMDTVQAGAAGSPGILTVSNSIMGQLLGALPPVSNSSWISGFCSAWEAGIIAGIITPGTAMFAGWIGSGGKDVLTLPIAATSIPTLSAAKTILQAGLQNVTSSNNPAMPLAQAIHDATLGLTFLCVGLGPPPALAPLPMPLPAN